MAGQLDLTRLVRAEIRKVRSVRMSRWLVLMAFGLVTLLVLVTVPTSDTAAGAGPSLHDHVLLARVVGVGAGGGWIVMTLIGIVAFTQELRYGTITSTYLVTPVRRRVLAAKAVALSAIGLVFAVAFLAVDVGLTVLVISAHGGNLTWSAQVGEVVAGVVFVIAAAGPVGVFVGALVRNQIAAVVGTLVWLLVAEQLLVALVPAIGRWTPGGAVGGVLQLGSSASTHGALLPAWAGGIVLVGYAALAGVLAAAVSLPRDVA